MVYISRTNCVCVFSINYMYTLNTWCVQVASRYLDTYVCVVIYLVPWLFLLFWAQCAHAQLNRCYPNVTHMRKDTRPSLPAFHTASDRSWVRPANVTKARVLYL